MMTRNLIPPRPGSDALIVRSARAGGCAVLLSEDLQHGQSYEGVRIDNPFATT
jgi:predicted nucleic acid-binding protein